MQEELEGESVGQGEGGGPSGYYKGIRTEQSVCLSGIPLLFQPLPSLRDLGPHSLCPLLLVM